MLKFVTGKGVEYTLYACLFVSMYVFTYECTYAYMYVCKKP